MKDTLNLEMMWDSFLKYSQRPELQTLDPQLRLHMAFIAGVQGTCTCLESDRSSDRYLRLCNELAMMRMEVTAQLESMRAQAAGKTE